jgi:hypothetical protein
LLKTESTCNYLHHFTNLCHHYTEIYRKTIKDKQKLPVVQQQFINFEEKKKKKKKRKIWFSLPVLKIRIIILQYLDLFNRTTEKVMWEMCIWCTDLKCLSYNHSLYISYKTKILRNIYSGYFLTNFAEIFTQMQIVLTFFFIIFKLFCDIWFPQIYR